MLLVIRQLSFVLADFKFIVAGGLEILLKFNRHYNDLKVIEMSSNVGKVWQLTTILVIF